MSKSLLDFQTPTGQSGNVLNARSWVSMIIGTVMLLATFSIGQNVARKVSGKVPGLDTQPDPLFPSAVKSPPGRVKIGGGM